MRYSNMSDINIIQLGTDENGNITVSYPNGKPGEENLMSESISDTQTDLSDEFREYAGVALSWNRIDKILNRYPQEGELEVGELDIMSDLLEQFPALSDCSDNILNAILLYMLDAINDWRNQVIVQDYYLPRVRKHFANQIQWNSKNPSFYADQTMNIEGESSWPIISVNDAGFHMCVGIIMQQDKSKKEYFALPFLKEIPFMSPFDYMRDIKEGLYDDTLRRSNVLTSFNYVSKNGFKSLYSYDILQIQKVLIHKYLIATNFFNNTVGITDSEHICSDILNICSEHFITQELDSTKETHQSIFNQMITRTTDVNCMCFDSPNPIKKYADFNYAMNDLISLNQIGMKQQHQSETKNFFKDFLDM